MGLRPQAFILRADERMLRQVLLNLLRMPPEALADDTAIRPVRVTAPMRLISWQSVVGRRNRRHGRRRPPSRPAAHLIPFFTTELRVRVRLGLALAHRVIRTWRHPDGANSAAEESSLIGAGNANLRIAVSSASASAAFRSRFSRTWRSMRSSARRMKACWSGDPLSGADGRDVRGPILAPRVS